MTSRLRTQAGKEHITVTDFLQATINNDGEKLLFSEAYAWCVQKNFSPSSPYPDHAQVDLTEDYLVYGLKVDGFRDNINVNSDKNIATHFKIQYGMKDASGNQVFAWYNGAVVSSDSSLSQLFYDSNFLIRVLFLTKYICYSFVLYFIFLN